MAWTVLLSTTSFTMDLHYCGETLVDVALFAETEGCGMEMQQAKSNSACEIVKKSCCTDEQINHQGQDELKTSFEKLSFDQQAFVTSYVLSYVNLFEGLETNVVPFDGYPPPILIKDVQLLHETFLI